MKNIWVLCALMFLPTFVCAETLFTPEVCLALATNSLQIMKARDNGFGKRDVELITNTLFTVQKMSPYTKKAMLSINSYIYESKPMSNHDTLVTVFSKCLDGDFEK